MVISSNSGGEGESRTREELSLLVVFKTTALDHYATSPHLRQPYSFVVRRAIVPDH